VNASAADTARTAISSATVTSCGHGESADVPDEEGRPERRKERCHVLLHRGKPISTSHSAFRSWRVTRGQRRISPFFSKEVPEAPQILFVLSQLLSFGRQWKGPGKLVSEEITLRRAAVCGVAVRGLPPMPRRPDCSAPGDNCTAANTDR
jgi:hypothetical protein